MSTTKIYETDNLELNGAIVDQNGSTGTTGQALVSTTNGTEWGSPEAGIPILLTTAILNNVSISASTSFAAVDIIGSQVLTSGATWTSSSSSVTIPSAGYYQISFGINTASITQRATPTYTILVDDVAIAGQSNDSYIRNGTTGIGTGCGVLTVSLSLAANAVIKIACKRVDSGVGTVDTDSSASFFNIVKLGAPAVTTGVVSSAESSEATRNIIIGTSATPPAVGVVYENTIYIQRET
jgi:hypothetical protein